MVRGLPLTIAVAAAVSLVGVACDGGGGSSTGGTPEATASDSPTPAVEASPIFAPMEGPERTFRPEERTNYRELLEFHLPDPASLPLPSADEDGPEFHPPETPTCPGGGQMLFRPAEGFQVCYPGDWRIGGHAYVTAGVDDRWYAVSLSRFGEDGRERAHVSIYVTNPYSQPFLYVADCQQAYQVKLDGRPASLCPDHPGEFPEAKIIAYHVRQGERDYFINVVPVFEYDSDAGRYRDSWSKEDEAMGIQIAQGFQFTESVGSP